MSTWVGISQGVVVDIRVSVKRLGALNLQGHDRVGLHEQPQLRVIPSALVEIDVSFLHLPGIAIIGGTCALGISNLSPWLEERSAF